MLVALTGPTCAGKHTVASYLTKTKNFRLLHIGPAPDATSTDDFSALTFPTLASALAYATTHWTHNHVMIVNSVSDWIAISKRPFALLVAVEAGVGIRFQRWKKKHAHFRLSASDCAVEEGTLEQFVLEDDARTFGTVPEESTTVADSNEAVGGLVGHQSPPPQPIYTLLNHASLRLANTFHHVSQLHALIALSDLTNPERLRPSWDTYFMHLCDLAARRSNCMKRRVGCILVKDKRIISTGYNGTPRGVRNCNEGGCGRCNAGAACGSLLDTCLCLHAEENALLEAGRERVDSGGWCILYCNTCPCLGCAKKIVQVGVKEVVYSQAYGMDDMTASLLKEAGIRLHQHKVLDNVFMGNEQGGLEDAIARLGIKN